MFDCRLLRKKKIAGGCSNLYDSASPDDEARKEEEQGSHGSFQKDSLSSNVGVCCGLLCL